MGSKVLVHPFKRQSPSVTAGQAPGPHSSALCLFACRFPIMHVTQFRADGSFLINMSVVCVKAGKRR